MYVGIMFIHLYTAGLFKIIHLLFSTWSPRLPDPGAFLILFIGYGTKNKDLKLKLSPYILYYKIYI